MRTPLHVSLPALLAVIALCLAVPSLAGCQGPSPQATPPPEAAATATPQPPPPTPGPYTWSYTTPRYGVSEAFRHDSAAQLRSTWERNVFSWADIQPEGPDDWRADLYFPISMVQRERDRGLEIVGVLQFTPRWAAEHPEQGERSAPRNLASPPDTADNYWAQFTRRIAAHYRGRIDRWIIWNEPEFKPGDLGAGESYTWMGSDSDYYLLLKRAYQGIKAGNPNATVVFGGTAYWVDVNLERRPFFQRVLDIAAADPEAKANGFFFDAVAFNLYRCPDDLYRIYTEMKAAMKARGIDKPIWLTETNAMPYDDPSTPKPNDGQRVTMAQQADYVIQGLAMAAAAGYEWISWYRIDDGKIWREQEVWGLVRDDGSPRPAFQAMKTALAQFTGATKITFKPLTRSTQAYLPWPEEPSSLYPNWRVYQVVFDHAGGRRVTVLWNGDGGALKVQIPRMGTGATLIDKTGVQKPLLDDAGWYTMELGAATASGPLDPAGYYFIGGPPLMIEEKGVPPDAPIQTPRIAPPA